MKEGLRVTIQSANRAHRVKVMEAHLAGCSPVWYVPANQVEEYAAAGATRVVGVAGDMPMKSLQLNAAINDGFDAGSYVATMDDDFVQAQEVYRDTLGKINTRSVPLGTLIESLRSDLDSSRFYLAGISSVTNPLWAKIETSDYGMISQLYVHKPGTPVRFNINNKHIEDLEYVIDHHLKHGGVRKVSRFLAEFHMFGRSAKGDIAYSGGYAGHRNESAHERCVDAMMVKYAGNPYIDLVSAGVGKSAHKGVNWRKLATNPPRTRGIEIKKIQDSEGLDNTLFAIISHKRAQNVAKMSAQVPNAVWYVGHGEGDEYRAAGAEHVVEAGGLMESRNRALDDAHNAGKACVQISDDLSGILLAGQQRDGPITVQLAVKMMADIAKSVGAKLAGTAPTDNRYYVDLKKPVKTHHFIVCDLIWVAPSSPRFDLQLRLKEDYDFTAQHLKAYGAVARVDALMPKFLHRTNAGGAVAYRTSELEQQAIAYLKAKWPGAITDNPRRPDEILFKGNRVLGS